MFDILPTDCLLLITYNLDSIFDVNSLISSSKELVNLYTDLFYLDWGRNRYTKNFWDKAERRTKCLTKPYINMKNELIQIEIFQNLLIKKKTPKWNNQDFFKYWEALEINYQKKLSCKGSCTPLNPSLKP